MEGPFSHTGYLHPKSILLPRASDPSPLYSDDLSLTHLSGALHYCKRLPWHYLIIMAFLKREPHDRKTWGIESLNRQISECDSPIVLFPSEDGIWTIPSDRQTIAASRIEYDLYKQMHDSLLPHDPAIDSYDPAPKLEQPPAT